MRLTTLAVGLLLSLSFSAWADDAQWKLVFEDNFERAEVGPDWKPASGMSIHNGRLRLVGVVNAQIKRGFSPDVRLEFDGWAIEDTPPRATCR